MLQVATVNSVGDLMLFLAKVAVTGTVCCIALPVLHADQTLHLYAVPLIVIAVFAFFITHCVFSVYEVSVLLLSSFFTHHCHYHYRCSLTFIIYSCCIITSPNISPNR